jgi:hypothetical protein
MTSGESFDCPLTQTDIAEATGLTPVHVNRTIKVLRSDGLLQLQGRRATIPDLQRLIDASLFNPDYLHLGREGRHLDTNS